MILKNDDCYNYVAIVNGAEYCLNKKSSINIELESDFDIIIKRTDKDYVHLNFLDIILGVFFGDSTITKINTEYHFSVDKDCDLVTIKDNSWTPREQLTINACYADSAVVNESYTMPNIEKVRKKHRRLHLFVTSLFPVYFVLIFLCFITQPITLWIIALVLLFLVFGMPSVKEIKRFKKATAPDYVNNKLCEYADERRRKGADYNEDTSKTGKLINKALGKMFKFDEE